MSDDEPIHEEPTAFDKARTAVGAWRLGAGVAVVILLGYSAVRVTSAAGEQAAAAQLAAGAPELQSSFDHYQAGRYQEAAAAARSALAADPNSAEAYNNLAVSYMGLHQIDQAIKTIKDAIRIRPDYQLARNNLAWFEREKARAAVSPAQAARATALLNQSLQHYQAKRFTECLDTALQSAKLNPSSAPALNNAGICAGALQLWDEGIRNTQEAIRVDPGFQLARNNLAWLQQEKLKADRAKAR